MKVESVRFGPLDVTEDRVVSFPESLPGFTGRRYVLIPEKDAPILEWLQSLDEPAVEPERWVLFHPEQYARPPPQAVVSN